MCPHMDGLTNAPFVNFCVSDIDTLIKESAEFFALINEFNIEGTRRFVSSQIKLYIYIYICICMYIYVTKKPKRSSVTYILGVMSQTYHILQNSFNNLVHMLYALRGFYLRMMSITILIYLHRE